MATQLYPDDIEREFIDAYYFDCDKKYRNEKLCRLRDNLNRGNCPKGETTIRAYCMWLEPRRKDAFGVSIIKYPHLFYGKQIPKCYRKNMRMEKRTKPKEFILIEEEQKSPEQSVNKSLNDALGLTAINKKQTEAYKKKMKKLKEERDAKKSAEQSVLKDKEFNVVCSDGELADDDAHNYIKAIRILMNYKQNDPDKILCASWLKLMDSPRNFQKRQVKIFVRAIIKKFENEK